MGAGGLRSKDGNSHQSASQLYPHAVRTTGAAARMRRRHELKLRIALRRVKTRVGTTNDQLQLVGLPHKTVGQIPEHLERLLFLQPMFRY